MNKLSDKKIIKMIWGISAVICCLLIYFLCLPFYQHLTSSGRSISGVKILILFVYTIFFLLIIPLLSYVTTLFLIDRLKLSQQILNKNKITGMLTTVLVLVIFLSPIISLKKLPIINDLFQVIIFWAIIPLTIILLSRFVLQKINKYPIFIGLVSTIAFNIFGFLYLSLAGIEGEQGYGMGLFILFESIAIGFISIVVNLIESKKMKTISGEIIK